MNWKMVWKSFILLLACTAACAGKMAAGIPQRVTVSGGSIEGVVGKDPTISVFKGIPYAAPPVGDLRWRAPQPVLRWTGVRSAQNFGNSCIQNEVYERKPWTHEFMVHNDLSEDCLYLNVWTPAKSRTAKLPVYLFIHGGGNVEGSGAVPVYDGEGLARKGIVVVTVNYRLGIFGFFTHPELTAEAPYHASGNYADLDIVAALHWIQENIEQFGGDRTRVTAGGQSAGAGHVFSLMYTPLAKGLFRGAIMESGVRASVITDKSVTLAESEKRGEGFAAGKAAKSIAELRRLSWQEIIEPLTGASASVSAGSFRGNVIDGYVFPLPAREAFEQGKANDVPVLTGINRNDNSGPVPHPDITLAAYQEQARKTYGDRANQFLQLYPATTDAEARTALVQSTWDLNRTGAYVWSLWHNRNARSSVFTYFWDHTLPGPDAEKYGAFHTSEVPYVLNTLYMSDRPLTAKDQTIADALSSYWADFIKNGDPNGSGLAHWPAVRQEAGTTMEIGEEYKSIPVAGDQQKLDFFQLYFTTPHAPAARPAN